MAAELWNFFGRVKAGSTSKLIEVQLDGASADYSKWQVWYIRQGATSGANINPTGNGTAGSWNDAGTNTLCQINGDVFQFSLPNAAIAAGADSVTIRFKLVDVGSANNGAKYFYRIELRAVDDTDSVRMGLTALPNAAAAANGGLPTVDGNNRIVGVQGTKNTFDALNDISEAQANAQCDLALSDAGVNTTRMGRLDAAVSTRSTPSDVLAQTGSALTAYSAVSETYVDSATDAILDALAQSFLGNPSNIDWTYTLNDQDGNPIADAAVWATSDPDGDTIVATARTNALGQVNFFLAAGTYYIFRQKVGFTFDNPDQQEVS